MKDHERSWSLVMVAILAIGTALLTTGSLVGLAEERLGGSTESVLMAGELETDGPLRVFASGEHILTIQEDGTVDLLDGTLPAASPPLRVTSAVGCEAGGVSLSLADATHVLCNGTAGPPGPAGGHSMLQLLARMYPAESPGSCPADGFLLLLGTDDGGRVATAANGRLEADEVEAEYVVCHGSSIPGPAGRTGPPGEQGLQGREGREGPQGDPGHVTIIESSDAPDGACALGGIRIRFGLDDGAGSGIADDGILHEHEATTETLCHGPQGDKGDRGRPGYAGLVRLGDATAEACPAGGTTIRAGLDDGIPAGTAGNGILEVSDPGEVDEVRHVCNGEDAEGDDGFNSIVRLEPARGCGAAGGVLLLVGLDDGHPGGIARDGNLSDADPGEVDDSEELCHGATGASGADGADGHSALVEEEDAAETCTDGKRIHLGVDDGAPTGTAANGVLEEAERDTSFLTCGGRVQADGACFDGAFVHGFDANGTAMCRPEDTVLSTKPRAPGTVTLAERLGPAEREPDVSVGSDGLPFVFVRGTTSMVYIHCDVRSCQESTSTPISGSLTYYPSVIVGPDGLPVLGHGSTVTGCLDLRCSTSWSVQVPGTIVDLWYGNDYRRGPSLSIAVWSSTLQVIQCDIADRCSSPTTTVIAGAQIAIVPAGHQILDSAGSADTFVTYRTAAGDLQRRPVSNSAATVTLTPVDNDADPVVATGLDGLPFVLAANRDVAYPYKIAKCANTRCTGTLTWTAITHGTIYSSPGDGPAMTIQDDGNPILTLPFEGGGSGVYLVDCHNTSCSVVTMKQLETRRAETDITLLREGSAVVTWYNAATQTVHAYTSGGPGSYGYAVRR